MNLIKSKVVRDGPLENLWKYQKNIRASIHAMAWKKKFIPGILVTKKYSSGSKIPFYPHNFSNGPSLSVKDWKDQENWKPVHTQYTVYTVTLRSISLNINKHWKQLKATLRFPCGDALPITSFYSQLFLRRTPLGPVLISVHLREMSVL